MVRQVIPLAIATVLIVAGMLYQGKAHRAVGRYEFRIAHAVYRKHGDSSRFV